MLRYLIILFTILIMTPVQAARLALVIGNNDYRYESTLHSPVNDARDMAKVLRGFGFTVIDKYNLTQQAFDQVVQSFEKKLRKYNVGLFYYSGHGLQSQGDNYLVPIDARIRSAVDIKYTSINANQILDKMEYANKHTNLLILDACRNNPYKSIRKGFNKGLAEMSPRGSLIAFATSPKMTALDGTERNSIYTKHLLRQLRTKPYLSVVDLLTQVAGGVARETLQKQWPWMSASLTKQFCFGACGSWESRKFKQQQAEFERQRIELERQRAELKQEQQHIQSERAKIRKKEEVKLKHRVPGDVFQDRLKDGGLGPEMVQIPKGRFQMGDIQGGGEANEKPVHWVNIDYQFAMGKYEVTFAEYDQFAQATDREKPSDIGLGRGRRPVINVSWNDANAYTKWLTQQTGKPYRLPSEAEWEYAARAGTKTKYWWGNSIGKNKANCDGCGSRWDYEVGSFRANQFGLYDTVGNVYEWVAGNYQDRYNGAPSDGSAWKKTSKYRVARGTTTITIPVLPTVTGTILILPLMLGFVLFVLSCCVDFNLFSLFTLLYSFSFLLLSYIKGERAGDFFGMFCFE